MRKILLAVTISTVGVTVMAAAFGPRGWNARKNLEETRAGFSEMKNELELERRRLEQEFDALLREPERLRLAARTLGYFEKNEKVLVVNGTARVAEEPRPPQLEPKLPENPSEFEGNFFRLFWLLLTLTVLAVMETREWLAGKKEGRPSRPSVKGIPGDARTWS